jgi:hypothetical protein
MTPTPADPGGLEDHEVRIRALEAGMNRIIGAVVVANAVLAIVVALVAR